MILTLSRRAPSGPEVLRQAGYPVGAGRKQPGRLTARAVAAGERAAHLSRPVAAVEDREGPRRAVVVTLGTGIEEEVRQLGLAGRVGEAVFLDAAGNALLAAACREAVARLSGDSESWAWVAPGCGGRPLSLVPEVVRTAGAAEVGVELLSGGMLRPEKTVAGWLVESPGFGQELCSGCSSPVCPWAGGR